MTHEKQEFVVCNCCGELVRTEGNPPYGEGLEVTKSWGFFSGKDGERHHFFLCEECYDKIVRGFAVPVEVEEVTELL